MPSDKVRCVFSSPVGNNRTDLVLDALRHHRLKGQSGQPVGPLRFHVQQLQLVAQTLTKHNIPERLEDGDKQSLILRFEYDLRPFATRLRSFAAPFAIFAVLPNVM